MDRRRGESVNWYRESMADRQRMMHEHGMIGRRYGDQVKQIISGSIGMDDWEWGVDLFAEDPVAFKKLIYEMRFDEVSAVYALFGQFYIGVRLPVENLSNWLAGKP
jgi:chlorite dismutase